MPVLAPIKQEPSGGRSRTRWLSLTALAILAAGLAMAVAFKGEPKQTAQVPARPAVAAIARIQPAPALPPPAPEPQGAGIQFKEVAAAPGTLAKQLPEACVNCWNKAHSGLDSDGAAPEASLAASLRPSGYTSPYSLEVSQFALPGNEYEGTRMGDHPASWQQCPQP